MKNHRDLYNFSGFIFKTNQGNKDFSKRSRFLPAVLLAAVVILGGTASRLESAATFSALPTSEVFGSVAVGGSATRVIQLTNGLGKNVVISSISATGTGFSISGINVPMTLRAGSTVQFSVVFSPKAAGSVSGTLAVTESGGTRLASVALSATGTGSASTGTSSGSSGSGSSSGSSNSKGSGGSLNVSPTSAPFGTVPVGTRNTRVIALQNETGKNMSIASITASGSGFSVSGINTPMTLRAGSTVQFSVAFLPESAGSVTGAMTVTESGGTKVASVALSGAGAGSSKVLGVSPSSISFGNVDVNQASISDITLTNSGNSSLSVSSVSISGTGLSETGVGNGTTIAPGQTAMIKAQFAPTKTGYVAGTLTVTSTATNSTVTVPVSGTGVTAPTGSSTHTVDLQWNASGTSGVTGYYVYRGTASGGPYSKLDSSPVNATSYADSNVSAGTYYYVVTAVDSAGTSGYSNQVTVTVP